MGTETEEGTKAPIAAKERGTKEDLGDELMPKVGASPILSCM